MHSVTIRFHRILVNETIGCLHKVFYENLYADRVLEHCFRKYPKFGSRDRAYIAENTYDIIRNRRLLEALLPGNQRKKISDLFLMLGIWHILKGDTLPPWDEFIDLRGIDFMQSREALRSDIRINESWPDWLFDLAEKQLGPIWLKEAVALNHPADVVLRTNTLKIDRRSLMNVLFEQAADIRLGLNPESLVLNQRINVFAMPAFQDGLFEVQDESSQSVSHLLQVEPGMRVIDACAGAGGKSLHIAALMKNKGQLISMDIYGKKLEELKKRARRAGAHNIETREINSLKDIKRLENTADRILLDVPCSGLGVIRRNPDAKWKLDAEFIQQVQLDQHDILENYVRMLKPGGKLVYATCSILPSENAEQVKTFLSQHPDYRLEEERQIYVHENNQDGFYMARIAKV